MNTFAYPSFPPNNGYLTEKIRQQYIQTAITNRQLPENAHRMPLIISLIASNDTKQPIQFWQLYSVLGPIRVQNFVRKFYQHVFADEHWFSSVFARIGGIEHHVNTQSAMWIDVMGGGLAYHGGEFRLSFHHTHNAIQLMNDKGAEQWVKHMVDTLNDPSIDLTNDSRVRSAVNTFLGHFMGKYAAEFKFRNSHQFGDINPIVKRKINFLNMSSDAIEALSEDDLKDALSARGIDVSKLDCKSELVNQALRL
jgi:truncated hemoglobin YjbI